MDFKIFGIFLFIFISRYRGAGCPEGTGIENETEGTNEGEVIGAQVETKNGLTRGQNRMGDLPESTFIQSNTTHDPESVRIRVNSTLVDYDDTARHIWPGPGFQCLDASVCELTRSSITKAVNVSNVETIRKANFYVEEYLKSQIFREEKTDLECREYAEKCWKYAQIDAITHLSLPLSLAAECDGSVLPNMLLFCDSESNGLDEWPENIKYLLGNNTQGYRPCRSSCDYYAEFKAYHLGNGKKYPGDFPKEWEKALEEAPEMRNTRQVDTILANFKTDSPHKLGTKRVQCPASHWLGALTFRRPFSVFMRCQNQFQAGDLKGEERISQGEVISSLEQFRTKDNVALRTQESNVNLNRSPDVLVPSGNYVIGLRLRQEKLGGMPYYKGAGVKGSGTRYHIIIEEYDWDMICPLQSAVCSLEFGSFGDGKYVDITSVGCCAMPIELYYSGLDVTLYEPVTIQSNRLEGMAEVNKSFNKYTDQIKDRGTDKKLEPLKKTFLCKPGEFIVSLDQYIRMFEIEASSGASWAGPYPFLETHYYCANGKGGPQSLLVNGLYDYTPYSFRFQFGKIELNKRLQKERYPYNMKVGKKIECQSGFVNQYWISRYIVGRMNNYNSIRWEETVWCTSDTLKSYSEGITWILEGLNGTMGICGYNSDEEPNCGFANRPNWDTEVKCKENEAVCGVEYSIPITDTVYSYVTIKLYHIRVICCPIPPIIVNGDTCCKAVDEYVFDAIPGEAIFYFQPSNSSLADKSELVASVTRILSPSQFTKADWGVIIENNYLKVGGQEAKSESVVGSGSENKTECPPRRKVWRKYTATCGDTTAVYYVGPEYTNNTEPICKNSKGDKCPDFCVATDRWALHAILKTLDEKEEEALESRSKVGVQCPLLKFEPVIQRDDYTYVQIENAVKNQLSPSPITGINYKDYFENFYAGRTKPKPNFTVDEDVPEGHFANVYRAKFECGKYEVTTAEWKKVLFKTGEDAANCDLAKANSVPLNGCKVM